MRIEPWTVVGAQKTIFQDLINQRLEIDCLNSLLICYEYEASRIRMTYRVLVRFFL